MTATATYGVTEIAELFPNLMDIQCEELREKVAATWNEAITTGCGGKGWSFDELRAVKFTLLAGDIEMTFIEHLNSCSRQCIAIADVLENAFSSISPSIGMCSLPAHCWLIAVSPWSSTRTLMAT